MIDIEDNKKMQSTIDAIIKSVKYMIDRALQKTTKSYDGIVKEINIDGTYAVQFNDRTQNVRAYSTYALKPNDMVKVIVPQGNMNIAYILPPSGGGGEESETVTSVNGQVGAVVLTKADIGLSNVPNLTTNNQTPTFTEAKTRTNITSGQTLSTTFGVIMKWFNDFGALAWKSTVSKTDLSQEIQTSLNKADTALQTAPVTSVNTKTGAVSLTASDVNALPISGGTMTGNINLGSKNITNLGAGVNDTDAVNKKQLDDAISGIGTVFNFKGAVSLESDLPKTNNKVGDVYFVEEKKAAYIWLTDSVSPEGRWEEFGEPIDLSGYLTKAGLAQTTGNDTTNAMSQKAITDELALKADKTDIPVDIKVATGTIATTAKVVEVAYTGFVLNVYAKNADGALIVTDIVIGDNKVTFSTVDNPSSIITCVVVYK